VAVLLSFGFFGISGVFVLLLACINFMNLSTARSEKRAREVGVRKAIGSLKSQLVQQFVSESFLVVLLAFVLSLAMVSISLLLLMNWLKEIRTTLFAAHLLVNQFCIHSPYGLVVKFIPCFLSFIFPASESLKGVLRLGLWRQCQEKFWWLYNLQYQLC